MTDKPNNTISMCALAYPDGTFGVQVLITGLASEEETKNAMNYVHEMLCADEIKTQ